jgi:site-specific DNA-cytosine methylase
LIPPNDSLYSSILKVLQVCFRRSQLTIDSLFINFAQWIYFLEPQAFVIENIKGLLSRQNIVIDHGAIADESHVTLATFTPISEVDI